MEPSLIAAKIAMEVADKVIDKFKSSEAMPVTNVTVQSNRLEDILCLYLLRLPQLSEQERALYMDYVALKRNPSLVVGDPFKDTPMEDEG